jgi:hypothetical protein
MEQDFEITGFVNFPKSGMKTGGTNIYLIAFSAFEDVNSDIIFSPKGNYVGDDHYIHQFHKGETLDGYLNNIKNQRPLNKIYESFSLKSCILLGWSNYSYEGNSGSAIPWTCSFRDLTSEGRKLYYSIKKLHNECEVRILTFKNT